VWDEESFVRDLVPELLTAGGKSLAAVADHWECHSWGNCPIAFAFSVDGIDGVPVEWRAAARWFIELFDSGRVPKPEVA
jgi:hypothetical protein